MAIHTTVAELIGNTPLVELHNVTDGVRAKIAVKVEYFNPGGSSKDRIAERIIGAAERRATPAWDSRSSHSSAGIAPCSCCPTR